MSDQPKDASPGWVQRLKRNPVVASLIVIVAVVTGLAAFTEALQKLAVFFKPEAETQPIAEAQAIVEAPAAKPTVSDEDAALRDAVVGTWQCNAKLPVPTGSQVLELRNIFRSSGRYESRGSYRFLGFQYPIVVSGKWEINDRILEYEVTSSNVPLAIAEGYEGETQLIGIEDGKMTYIDTADGQMKVDYRIE